MRADRVRRAAALLVWILLPAAASVVRCERALSARTPAPEDAVMRALKRFAPVKSVLGAAPRVGYLTDVEASAVPGSRYAMQFFLTRYALAPAGLLLSEREPLVVGHFSSGALLLQRTAAYELVQDFGRGVVLLRPRDP